jgi:hypothetical protein
MGYFDIASSRVSSVQNAREYIHVARCGILAADGFEQKKLYLILG